MLVITPNAGLRSAETHVTPTRCGCSRRSTSISTNPAYRVPLDASARRVARAIGDAGEVVLLGTIASPKYVDVLLDIFGARLLFPTAFVGRGDMSRGGLLLRHARAGTELDYVPVQGAVRHGQRPPKLSLTGSRFRVPGSQVPGWVPGSTFQVGSRFSVGPRFSGSHPVHRRPGCGASPHRRPGMWIPGSERGSPWNVEPGTQPGTWNSEPGTASCSS